MDGLVAVPDLVGEEEVVGGDQGEEETKGEKTEVEREIVGMAGTGTLEVEVGVVGWVGEALVDSQT